MLEEKIEIEARQMIKEMMILFQFKHHNLCEGQSKEVQHEITNVLMNKILSFALFAVTAGGKAISKENEDNLIFNVKEFFKNQRE